MLEVVDIVLWYSGGMAEPVEESGSDVNFSMGVAARGKTEVEFAATFTFSSLWALSVMHLAYSGGFTGSIRVGSIYVAKSVV